VARGQLAFTLALALPDGRCTAWLAPFARGLLALADAHQCELVGGDTTRGPLNICITVFGEVPVQQGRGHGTAAFGRVPVATTSMSAARWGTPGWRWSACSGHQDACHPSSWQTRQQAPAPALPPGSPWTRPCAEWPAPPSTSATACSAIWAMCWRPAASAPGLTPIAWSIAWPAMGRNWTRSSLPTHQLRCVLAGGDDYELAFTAPADRRDAVAAAAQLSATPVSRVGTITATGGLQVVDAQGAAITGHWASFDHFS
jgi:thiamine-monophosphate kinase